MDTNRSQKPRWASSVLTGDRELDFMRGFFGNCWQCSFRRNPSQTRLSRPAAVLPVHAAEHLREQHGDRQIMRAAKTPDPSDRKGLNRKILDGAKCFTLPVSTRRP